jgi:hypothetical protein
LLGEGGSIPSAHRTALPDTSLYLRRSYPRGATGAAVVVHPRISLAVHLRPRLRNRQLCLSDGPPHLPSSATSTNGVGGVGGLGASVPDQWDWRAPSWKGWIRHAAGRSSSMVCLTRLEVILSFDLCLSVVVPLLPCLVSASLSYSRYAYPRTIPGAPPFHHALYTLH